MAVENLTSKNFNDFVSSGVNVVDFSAEWCAPCKVMKPIFEESSSEGGDFKFGAVDIDKDGDLAQKFGVMSVPTLIFFKDGEQVDRVTGVMQKDEILRKTEEISK